jgi:tetratricopeptide (TPR) repeat protein
MEDPFAYGYTCRKLLRQALKIFSDPEHSKFNPEKARAYFKLGQALHHQGEINEAQEAYAQAEKLYRELKPEDHRPWKDLNDADFDKNIMFWSR